MISILFSRNQPPKLKGYVDGTLVFGLPVVAFSLQVPLVEVYHYGLAWSALFIGIYYFSLSFWLKKNQQKNYQLLAESFFAFGLIFVSLVIPFVFDSEWTAASWAMEGAGLIWIGVKQQRWFAKYLGILVQFIGSIIFLSDINFYQDSTRFFDAQLMGIIFVAIGAIFSAYQFLRNQNYHLSVERILDRVFLVAGLLWWYLGWFFVIARYFDSASEMHYLVLFLSITGIAFFALEKRYRWADLSQIGWVSLALFSLLTLQQTSSHNHLLGWQNISAWSVYFLSFYGILYWRDKQVSSVDELSSLQDEAKQRFNAPSKIVPIALNYLHFAIGLMLFYVCANEFEWFLRQQSLLGTTWGIALFGLMLSGWLYLVAGLTQLSKIAIWPMTSQPKVYYGWLNGFLLIFALAWALFENFSHNAAVNYSPYIPLLNPLDLTLILLCWLFIAAIQQFLPVYPNIKITHWKIFAGGFVFIWLNIILLRSLNSWADESYRLLNWQHSVLVQTSLSIFWTIIAMTITIFASKNEKRQLWFVGTGLIGITVIKLFTIDLGNSSSVERIVSFIVVGLLLLIMGYFSPLPAKNAEAKD